MQSSCGEGILTYRSSSDTTVLEFLECGRGSFWSLNELEFALRAIGALRLGRHDSYLLN
jgi:hypothetical protein